MQHELQPVKLNTYHTLIQLAKKHKAEGLCQMAEDLYKQALAIARVLEEPNPLLLTEALYELANYYEFLGKEAEAELLWHEVRGYEEYFEPNHYIYVQSILSLAYLQEKKGNIEIAEQLYKELLQKQEIELGDESLEICEVLDNLAEFYCRQKRYAAAETLYLRILVIKEFHVGTCSPEINYTVNALIDIFQKLGKVRLAEYMLNRQKAILLALHGKDSLCVASCALRLADLQIKTNRLDKAIENLSSSIQIFKNRFGELAGPVISLQDKLNTLLISGMEIVFEPFPKNDSEEPITLNLDTTPHPTNIPSLASA